MNTKIFAHFLVLALVSFAARSIEVKSPDGKIVANFAVKSGGALFYNVSIDGRVVLADSQLGLTLKDGPALMDGFTVAKTTTALHDEKWKPVCGERSEIRDHYNEVTIELTDSQNPPRKLQIVFRAYNEGVAFCYSFPEQAALKKFTVAAENTRFQFTGDYTTWAVSHAQSDYAGIKARGGRMPLSKIMSGAERPLPVEIAGDLYCALAEAKNWDFSRMKFQLAKDGTNALESILDGPAEVAAPYRLPWRVVMVGNSPGKLLENNFIIPNLNPPCAIADTSWIKPGKVIRETTLTTDGGKACVDFCVARNIQYVLFDAGWYGYEYDKKSDASGVHVDPKRSKGPLDLQAVIDYGKTKGIGVILYVNHLALEQQLDQVLPLYEKWGVAGIKFGFVNVGPQQWTTWLNEGVRKCAEHHLMVDVHDEQRPTGINRTYPNWMTMEGIGGNEEFPTPAHNATLPFTRFLAGPADYTYCWYSGRLKNSHAHQLALTVIFFSPWQVIYWYDKPSMYKGEKELEFWDALPVTWDETRVINGKIGECVTVARRKGNEWWVGSIRAVKMRSLAIPLSFLEAGQKYTATIYTDANPDSEDPGPVKIETKPVDSTTVIEVAIPEHGGHAMRIVPQAGP